MSVRLIVASEVERRTRSEKVPQQDQDETREEKQKPGIASVRALSPPPQYPVSEASSSRPPPFSSLFDSESVSPPNRRCALGGSYATSASSSLAAPAYAPFTGEFLTSQSASNSFDQTLAETKRALPRDTKNVSAAKDEDAEPPPAYSEGPSPLHSFTYLMANAGGASSIITQVQQGGPPINAIGGESCPLDRYCQSSTYTEHQMSERMRLSSWTFGKIRPTR